jgi:hypothetical protein
VVVGMVVEPLSELEELDEELAPVDSDEPASPPFVPEEPADEVDDVLEDDVRLSFL